MDCSRPARSVGTKLVRMALGLLFLRGVCCPAMDVSELHAQTPLFPPVPEAWSVLRTLPADRSPTGSRLFLTGQPQGAPQIPSQPRLSSSQRRGMRIGAGIGVVTGALVGWSLAPEAPDTCVLECGVEFVAAALSAGFGALSGLVVGGGIGLAVGTLVDDDNGGVYGAMVTFAVR
jgi:hypothetical protein